MVNNVIAVFLYKRRYTNYILDQKRTRFCIPGHKYNSSNFPYLATGPHVGPHFKNIVLITYAKIYKMLPYIGPNVVPLPYNI